MSAQHTPGPWTFTGTREVRFGSQLGRIEGLVSVGSKDNAGNVIAIVHMGGTGGITNSERAISANAQLIAEAPNLLRTLTVIADALDTLDGLDNIKRLARAAIAKATGEAA